MVWAFYKQGAVAVVRAEVEAARWVHPPDAGAEEAFEYARRTTLEVLDRLAPGARNVRASFGGDGPAVSQLLVLSM